MTGVATQTPAVRQSRRRRLDKLVRPDRPTIVLHCSVIAGLLVLSILMWWHVWFGGHPASTLTCQCGDVSEALHFLAWTPYAITHGHNPFLSNALFAGQGGVNMLDNAAWFVWAALFAPITWLFGPIATLNVVATLGPVLSGWCFFLAVRRFTTFVPGQIAGALLYAFSPVAMNALPLGHFFEFWLFYPPLLVLLLHELYTGERYPPVLVGVTLGVLTVIQFSTSTEILVICALAALIGSAVAALSAPRATLDRLRPILQGLGTAAGICVVVLAYPIWFALAGPRHVSGAIWPGTDIAGVFPTGLFSAHETTHAGATGIAPAFNVGPPGPNLTYLGAVLTIFLALSATVWCRRRMARILFVVGLASWLLSLGTSLTTFGPAPEWIAWLPWLPWRALAHAPVLEAVIPNSFSVVTILVAALLLSISTDAWWHLARHRRSGERSRRFTLGVGAILAAVAGLTLVPAATAYAVPFTVQAAHTPEWFRTAAPRLPAGTVVVAYPFPGPTTQQAMGWQAIDAMHFRLVGGYDVVPGRDGRHSAWLTRPVGATLLLDELSEPLLPLPLMSGANVMEIRGALHRWHAQDIVVTHIGRAPLYAAAYLTAVTGRLPVYEHRAWVWYGLGDHPPTTITPAAFHRCLLAGRAGDPLAVPRCVIDSGA